ncbi:FkbM family methyltransferase [Tabrizicola sp.]|uniref:FkbM family methyltransferase n=1 Tax=Tabrizicola sp. TaxID=2005166 RepID=UPI0027367B80|nr:FkbM family methyltransferase [Tabrizicola sp.]MDP3195303.1 FkbM family methyltransferase [Tabrizicola sp.]
MKFLRKILAAFGWRSARIDEQLSPQVESRLGLVPALDEGTAGHNCLLEIFFTLLAEVRPAVFCDIGANQGEAGRRAIGASTGVNVFSFEANPEIHERYREINEAAGVHWMNLAVSEENGHVTLNIPRVLDRALVRGRLVQGKRTEARDTGKASLLFRDENAIYDQIDVTSTTIDDFLAREAPEGSVVLWLDVEGAASKVLSGAAHTLRRTDLLIVEVEGFAFWRGQKLIDEVLDMLSQQGFIPVLRDREYGDAQFNVVFLRGSAAVAAGLVDRIASALDKPRLSENSAIPARTAITPSSVPVLIPCFNNPTYVYQMLEQLVRLGFKDITLVDNASDSTEMLALLSRVENEGIRVDRLAQNLGPHLSIFTKERLAGLPKYFCVTDPDLVFNPFLPPDFLQTMRYTLEVHGGFKVGFALDISQPWRLKQDKFTIGDRRYRIYEWEERFWRKRLGFTAGGDAIFRAEVDTTFALYDRDRLNMKQLVSGLRLAGRFTAEHLPWLGQATMSRSEEDHYRSSQKFSYYLGSPSS